MTSARAVKAAHWQLNALAASCVGASMLQRRGLTHASTNPPSPTLLAFLVTQRDAAAVRGCSQSMLGINQAASCCDSKRLIVAINIIKKWRSLDEKQS